MLMNCPRLAARKYARIVQKLGFPTKFKDFKRNGQKKDKIWLRSPPEAPEWVKDP